MTPAQIEAREAAVSSYIKSFTSLINIQENVELTVEINEAAKSIVTLYDRNTEEVVRPTLVSGIIQNFKIIANTELAVMRISPIIFSANHQKEKMYNAQLALYIALCLIIEWNNLDEAKVKELLENDKEISSFTEEHLKWLYLLEPRYYYPIFSNSQVWRLFYYLIRDRIKS